MNYSGDIKLIDNVSPEHISKINKVITEVGLEDVMNASSDYIYILGDSDVDYNLVKTMMVKLYRLVDTSVRNSVRCMESPEKLYILVFDEDCLTEYVHDIKINKIYTH